MEMAAGWDKYSYNPDRRRRFSRFAAQKYIYVSPSVDVVSNIVHPVIGFALLAEYQYCVFITLWRVIYFMPVIAGGPRTPLALACVLFGFYFWIDQLRAGEFILRVAPRHPPSCRSPQKSRSGR
jgi:hypothetical protein